MSGPNPKALYVIRDHRTQKYWNAGYCDRDTVEEASKFENNERDSVRLLSTEQWEKVK